MNRRDEEWLEDAEHFMEGMLVFGGFIVAVLALAILITMLL